MISPTLEDIVSLTKRRGFIFAGSEIYGGLSGTWDYGPLGVSLKRKIESLWWEFFVERQDEIYGIDSTILMNPKVWQASGHVGTFNDPLIEDKKNKKRYRLDHVLEDSGIDCTGLGLDEMVELIQKNNIKTPDGNDFGNAGNFNLMFKTFVGSLENESSIAYLRPETAQGMFVNYKNIIDTFYPDLPFGLAQIGRNFRNEIAPRDFIFRSREFEIMEFEYFVYPNNWEKEFDKLLKLQIKWYCEVLGLDAKKLHQKEIKPEDRAHYSKRTIDFEYQYPFGLKEIGGFAYRTDFDLKNHQQFSGKSMEYLVKGTNERFIPHVLEPTFGLDRCVLAILCEAYRQDTVNSETRTFLKLDKKLAPYLISVSPLLKNKTELYSKARDIYELVRSQVPNVNWDDNGNIGKRYRRQDEIGTPYCVTIDFDTIQDGSVTIRNRDTTTQERIKIDQIIDYVNKD
jgi:glycyl-tRNA synthetase